MPRRTFLLRALSVYCAFGPLQYQLGPLLQNAKSKNPPLYATKYTLIVYPIISLRFAKFHDIIKTCCIIISQLKRIRGNCVMWTPALGCFFNTEFYPNLTFFSL